MEILLSGSRDIPLIIRAACETKAERDDDEAWDRERGVGLEYTLLDRHNLIKRVNTNTCVVPLVLSAPLGQVINPGWLGSAQTALLLGDKGNPTIIFTEQGILISTLPGGRKPKSSAKGFLSEQHCLAYIQVMSLH